MRFLFVIVLAACGAHASGSTIPALGPVHPTHEAPAADLALAKRSMPAGDGDAKDPRVVDLDIIRITASTRGVGGEVVAEHVATADLFKQANDAAKAKETERAIALYRRIVVEFPESKYAPISLFNIAAILDGRGDYAGTLAALRELVKGYPAARESIDGHLYISALQSDREDWPEALATLDEIVHRENLTYADRIEVFARKGYIL